MSIGKSPTSPDLINISTLPSVRLSERARLPCQPGVYFAIATDGAVLYIGRSQDLATRWNSTGHHRYAELSLHPGVRLAWLTINDASLLPEIEAACIQHFQPALNGNKIADDPASYRTIKIRPETYRELRVLAAKEGTTMLALLDRLVSEARDKATDKAAGQSNTGDSPAAEKDNTAS